VYVRQGDPIKNALSASHTPRQLCSTTQSIRPFYLFSTCLHLFLHFFDFYSRFCLILNLVFCIFFQLEVFGSTGCCFHSSTVRSHSANDSKVPSFKAVLSRTVIEHSPDGDAEKTGRYIAASGVSDKPSLFVSLIKHILLSIVTCYIIMT